MATTRRQYYDYIVVGCGGVGSAALYWLSKRAGQGVLGIEQFELGHSNGGSQDHSRIIRNAYHDDMYTKLTPETYKAWEEAEAEAGIQVLYRTGGVILAKKGVHEAINNKYAEAMSKHNIPFESLTGSELRRKFPQFNTDDEWVALYQKDGGLVDAAMANAMHVQLARGNGATVIDNCPVVRLQKRAQGGMLVTTTKGDFFCRKVIVTSGAWINHVLGSIGVHVPVKVTQEQVTYVATPNMGKFTKDKFPIWIYNEENTDVYGLPIHGNTGFKIGMDAAGPVVTADTRSFIPDPVREKICMELTRKLFPEGDGPIMYSKTCLYTITPDRHFVVDSCKSSGYDDVVVCCGAGHAYKFAGLLGKILSQLAVDGRTNFDISGFNIDRPAITDPNFKPGYVMGMNAAGDGQAQKSKL